MDQENSKKDQDELVNILDADLEDGIKQETEDTPLQSPSAECKICQAEDYVSKLESPCHCSGTLKYAHRDCIQRWINSCYNTVCEICKQPYEGGFTITVPLPPTLEELEALRVAQMAREEAEREVERARAEARRAAGEALAAMLPDLNNRAISESLVCRISSILCAGIYIFFMVALITGLLDLRFRPPSCSPSPHSQAPDQSPPQLFMKNISARALRFWL